MRFPFLGKLLDFGLEAWIVYTATPDVEQIELAIVGNEPRGANRPIVTRSAFIGRVPALQHEVTGHSGWYLFIAFDPVLLDHGPAGRHRRLLILRREQVR